MGRRFGPRATTIRSSSWPGSRGGLVVVARKGYLDKTIEPWFLTHRAPVLAADGRPLRDGETVWEVETGDGYVVERIYSGTTEPDFPGHTVACHRPDDIVAHTFKPSQLTHERPDTWERLEEDATKLSPYYYARDVMGLDTDRMPPKESRRIDMMRDIVRRAKKLAERGK